MELRLVKFVCFAIVLMVSVPFAAGQASSAPGRPLPPGPMQAKVKAACTHCHDASRVTEQHMSRAEWSKQLEKMEGLGAVVPDADRTGILNYLTRNFGPQKGSSKSAARKSAN